MSLKDIIDNSFGMFLMAKEDNPIYKNLRNKAEADIKAYFKELMGEKEKCKNCGTEDDKDHALLCRNRVSSFIMKGSNKRRQQALKRIDDA